MGGGREVGLPDAQVLDRLPLGLEVLREGPESDGRGGLNRLHAGSHGLHPCG